VFYNLIAQYMQTCEGNAYAVRFCFECFHFSVVTNYQYRYWRYFIILVSVSVIFLKLISVSKIGDTFRPIYTFQLTGYATESNEKIYLLFYVSDSRHTDTFFELIMIMVVRPAHGSLLKANIYYTP